MGCRPGSKMTVEECDRLRICDLMRAGVFRAEPGIWCSCKWTDRTGKQVRIVAFRLLQGSQGEVIIHFRQEVASALLGPPTVVNETVRLTTTRCYFGGERRWFSCPRMINGRRCGRRVGVLYLLPSGHNFGCRACFGLTYMSTQAHDGRVDRLLRLPLEEFSKVLRADAMKFGLLADRVGAVLQRRLRKKAAGHSFRVRAESVRRTD